MDFDEYQQLASRTAHFARDDQEYKLMYLSMGLAGETGEVIEKIKHIIRDDGGAMTDEKKVLIQREIGDVVWYCSQLARTLGFSFQEIAKINIDKLADRAERNKILSRGDMR